jgi:hypothetical protein
MSLEALDNRRTPERRTPLMGGVVWEDGVPSVVTVGSSGATLTAAQLLTGLIILNCTDTGNLTLPTATAIMEACPGLSIGSKARFRMINHGDSTATLVMGSGITNYSLDSAVSVLTIATNQGLEFELVVTGKANPSDPSKSNTMDFHGYGVTAAATA